MLPSDLRFLKRLSCNLMDPDKDWSPTIRMHSSPSGDSDLSLFVDIRSNFFVQNGAACSWTETKSENWLPVPVLSIGATILTLTYAGRHAIAWNSHFRPTSRDHFGAVHVLIASGGPFAGIMYYSNLLCENILHHLQDIASKYVSIHILGTVLAVCASVLYFTALSAAILLYALARVFIVVEAFISVQVSQPEPTTALTG